MSGDMAHITAHSEQAAKLSNRAHDGAAVLSVHQDFPGYYSGAADDGSIPSAPQNLKVSTKRTEQLIKIRWEKPQHHAHAVCRYEMQMRSKYTGWSEICTSTKCSAKASHLAPDTKYYFRVRAVNARGQPSDFSDEVAAETRMSKAARAILSPLVFLGGTVASPFLGAVGGGVAAGNAAKAKVDSKVDSKAGAATARAAAGVAGAAGGAVLATVGAPVVGGVAVHRFVRGQSWSPQSSDDEC